MSDKPVYIHYGHDEFKTPRPIKNVQYFAKPFGGLWASRKDCEHSWKDWCECEEFRLESFDKSFEFMLKDSAKVLILDDRNQLDILPKTNDEKCPYIKDHWDSTCFLDFETLAEEYDAIELVDCTKFYWALYGWDCNSILIMNPDIVELIS